jgi:hypothetical protein
MIKHYISHRGNLDGRVINLENSPDYISKALSKEYEVEIDVWFVNDSFYLGHDEPLHLISKEFLENEKLWCHGKNPQAIVEMKKYAIHYFWHQSDILTLTSKNYIWVYPGMQPIERSIAVMPEIYNDNITKCIGICSDYIKNYR